MTRKFVILMLLFGLVYILFAYSVMRFYKDDPEYMDLADRQKFNQNYLAKLSANHHTEKKTVVEHLGTPDITEAKQVSDTVYQIMFYRTRQLRDDNITTKDECTPLLFIDGLLIAWGNDAYKQYQSY